MPKVWIVARHEYGFNIRRPGFILFTALVPVIGLLVLLVAALFGGRVGALLERGLGMQSKTIGVVDEQGTFTPILPQYSESFRSYPDEEAGRAALRSEELDVLFVIPPDYMSTGRVVVVTREGGLAAESALEANTTRAFFVDHLLQGKVDADLQTRISVPLVPQSVSLDGSDQGHDSPGALVAKVLVPYLLGMFLVITIFVSSGYLLQGVAEEKSNRVMEVILSSISARQMLAGKVLGLGALGLTQVLVWLASAFALSGGAASLVGLSLPTLGRADLLILAVLYYALGFTIYAVLMGASGALGTTQQESQQLAGIFSLLASLPFFVAGFVIQNPNMPVARVLSWFPLTAPTMMLLRLPMGGVPWVDIVGSIAMSLLSIPLIIWAGAKVFRLGLLMYGKRPDLALVWKTLRQS